MGIGSQRILNVRVELEGADKVKDSLKEVEKVGTDAARKTDEAFGKTTERMMKFGTQSKQFGNILKQNVSIPIIAATTALVANAIAISKDEQALAKMSASGRANMSRLDDSWKELLGSIQDARIELATGMAPVLDDFIQYSAIPAIGRINELAKAWSDQSTGAKNAQIAVGLFVAVIPFAIIKLGEIATAVAILRTEIVALNLSVLGPYGLAVALGVVASAGIMGLMNAFPSADVQGRMGYQDAARKAGWTDADIMRGWRLAPTPGALPDDASGNLSGWQPGAELLAAINWKKSTGGLGGGGGGVGAGGARNILENFLNLDRGSRPETDYYWSSRNLRPQRPFSPLNIIAMLTSARAAEASGFGALQRQEQSFIYKPEPEEPEAGRGGIRKVLTEEYAAAAVLAYAGGGVEGLAQFGLPAIGTAIGGPIGGAIGSLLAGQLFKSHRPAPVVEPIPVKVMNWEAMEAVFLSITGGQIAKGIGTALQNLAGELRMKENMLGLNGT